MSDREFEGTMESSNPTSTPMDNWTEKIFLNSCDKCNQVQDHSVDAENNWPSTCNEFQCEKHNPRREIQNAGSSISQDDDNDSIDIDSGSPLSVNLHIDELPLEVLSSVFQWLDGHSLYVAGNVSTRWRDLIQSTTKKHQREFERTIEKLWPYEFRQLYSLMDYQVFSSLLRSVNCNQCFLLECGTTPITCSTFPLLRSRRINKELKELPCEGIHAVPFQNSDRINKVMARIEGPKDSAYENGIFYLIVDFSVDVPFMPPKVRFLTRIFHPAISCHGHISMDLLTTEWSSVYTIRTVLLSIQSVLTDTHLELCEHTPIGKLYKENKPEYERIARSWTEKYAMQHLIHPPPPPPALPEPDPNNV